MVGTLVQNTRITIAVYVSPYCEEMNRHDRLQRRRELYRRRMDAETPQERNRGWPEEGKGIELGVHLYSSYNYCMLPYLVQVCPMMLLASV